MTHTTLLLDEDGERAARAADLALDRADREGGVVHAVRVVDTARYGEPALSAAELVLDEAEDEARDRLAALAARGAERGVTVETHCRHGRPPEELLATARRVDADVVVVPRRLPHRVRTRLTATADAVVRPEARSVA